MLDVIAARILTVAVFPQDTSERSPAASRELLSHPVEGWLTSSPALRAASALSLASPVPGQLAGLRESLGISGHGITAPPAGRLPERWRSMLTSYHSREPLPALAAAAGRAPVTKLPEVDGARFAILGLHYGEFGTILYMLASDVTEDDWAYSRGVRPLPALRIRDSGGRWHATRTNAREAVEGHRRGHAMAGDRTPLDRAAWIDVVGVGISAEFRARLLLY